MANRHLQEGEEHIKAADKCMKTSFLKWKPDYDGAAMEYAKAAISFKNAKALDKCRDAYVKAADFQQQLGSTFHAAKALEAAGLVCRDMKDFERVANLMLQAGQLFREHGTPDTAALTWEKAGKILEEPLPEAAIEMYKRASDVTEGEDRPRQAAESVGKIARLLVRLRRYEEASDMIKREIDLNAQSDNYPSIIRLVVGAVLIHLTRTDYVAAEKVYKAALRYPGFSESDDAGVLSTLLDAYDSEDGAVLNKTLALPMFRHLENDFAKLARSLRASVKDVQSDNAGGGAEEEDEFSGGLC